MMINGVLTRWNFADDAFPVWLFECFVRSLFCLLEKLALVDLLGCVFLLGLV